MAPSEDRRPGFSRRAQLGQFITWVLGIAGAIVGVVLLAFSTARPAALAPLRAAVAEVTAPVATGIAAASGWIAAVPDAIGTYFFVHDENARLRAELARVRPALVQGRQAFIDNLRLRRLLALRERDVATVVVARIVSTSASSTRRYGLLNAGAWQGVAQGQPVRGPDGLIGRVTETGPNTARVLLVTDAESVVPVRRLRDGHPALAAGRGDGLVDIRAIQTDDAKFRPGDIYVTSGTGGIFAPGVPVARVLKGGGDSVPARPYARPDTLDFAIVSHVFITPPPPAPVPTPSPSPSASPSAQP